MNDDLNNEQQATGEQETQPIAPSTPPQSIKVEEKLEDVAEINIEEQESAKQEEVVKENQAEEAKETISTEQNTNNTQQNTGMAILAYILFFIPLLTDSKKDPFVMYHIKQGAVIFSMAIIIWIIQMMLPFSLMWNIMWLFQLIGLGILVLAILGILNAAAGKKEPLPLVGKFGDLFKF